MFEGHLHFKRHGKRETVMELTEVCTPDRNDRMLEKVTILLVTILDWVEAGTQFVLFLLFYQCTETSI